MADQQGVPIEKAAELLDRSPQTIVRWLKSGRLSGRKETVDGRERWLIDIPDNPPDSRSDPPPLDVLLASKDDRIADLQAEIQTLKGELAGKAKFVKVNAAQERATAAKYKIQAVPTLFIFKGGEVTDSLIGFQAETEIRNRLLSVAGG